MSIQYSQHKAICKFVYDTGISSDPLQIHDIATALCNLQKAKIGDTFSVSGGSFACNLIVTTVEVSDILQGFFGFDKTNSDAAASVLKPHMNGEDTTIEIEVRDANGEDTTIEIEVRDANGIIWIIRYELLD